MEAASGKGGTVTSLSSIFPAEEALKASQRVHETISERREELDTLHNFVTDNNNLINLVRRLPDELHHQIMVPFGKAAFFPGRLVHTNEFTVFLGENYYAERTAKQTIDILSRRGKTLESHVDSLKAVIEDLKTEASFFDKTAGEAEEGLVEIREEYTEENSGETDSISGRLDASRPSEEGNGGGAGDDEEYARIMSRFDELEREELEAEDDSEDEEQEDTEEPEDEREDFEDLEEDEHGDSEEEDNSEDEDSKESEEGEPQLEDVTLRYRDRGESSHGKALMQTEASMPYKKDYVASSILKTRSQSSPKSKQVSFQIPEPVGGNRIVRPVTNGLKAPVQMMPKSDTGSQVSRTKLNTDTLQAFSGTIVERTDNLPLNPEKQTATQQPTSSQTSRPVSRFKMQRMAHGSN